MGTTSDPRTLVVIQARTGSSRLPGKVLRELGGRPVLSWVVAAGRAGVPDGEVVIATTVLPEDDPVAALAEGLGAEVVRGPVDDVLARFVTALDRFGGERIVRLTADCPLLDPEVIAVAESAAAAGGLDYVSTVTPRTLPRGLDVEVVSAEALRRLDEAATGVDRVHVTSHLHRSPGGAELVGLAFAPDASDLRVTLDTPEDAALLDAVVASLGRRASSRRDLVAFLRANPDIAALNATVLQKTVDEG